jgi:Xaa-Pro dipeptidase
MRLTVEGCRARQQRLIEVLNENGLDGAIISRREHVYYFTGWLHKRHHAAAAMVRADGEVTLVAADADAEVAADKIVPYETGYLSTMHNRQYEMVAEKLAPCIPEVSSWGVDMGGGVGCIVALAGSDARDITPFILRLRKNKHDDEVEAIRGAIDITEAIYDAAKEAVRPGADEIEVFGYLRQEATKRAGEDLEHFGTDYRANDRSGAARRRTMQAGELYILDAGPSLHGYHADNCRTFAVDRQPSKVQLKAWETIDGLLPELETVVRPGTKASELFRIADETFKQAGYQGMVHHLGHGIGLLPHEPPELNPNYDAVFEVGDVFTMEPGIYAEEMKAGIRLEENYHLTDQGLERLTSYSRQLS